MSLQESSIHEMTEKERWDVVLSNMHDTNVRIDALQTSIEILNRNTDGVVKAFNNIQGTMAALEWLGKVLKPLTWLFGGTGVITLLWYEIRRRMGF